MSGAEPITDYPELVDVAEDDELYIVDKSDTTESAEGTSKQITHRDLSTGAFAEKVPSAYLFHDATATLATGLTINIPFELNVDAVFTGNLFTNSGDGLMTSSSTRAFKAGVHFDLSTEVTGGNVATFNMFIRKNGLATSTGEFSRYEVSDNAPRPTSIYREIDFALGDTVALWVMNTDDSYGIRLFSLSGCIEFIGWL